jgi:hypothetical protein
MTLEAMIRSAGIREQDLVLLRRRAARLLEGSFLSVVHVHKTGGSSLWWAIANAAGTAWAPIDLYNDLDDHRDPASVEKITAERARGAIEEWGAIAHRRLIFHHHAMVCLPRQLLQYPKFVIIREPAEALLSGYSWVRQHHGFKYGLESYVDSIMSERETGLPNVMQSVCLARMLNPSGDVSAPGGHANLHPSWIITLEDFKSDSRIAEALKFALGITWKPIHVEATISNRVREHLPVFDQQYFDSPGLQGILRSEEERLFKVYSRVVGITDASAGA